MCLANTVLTLCPHILQSKSTKKYKITQQIKIQKCRSNVPASIQDIYHMIYIKITELDCCQNKKNKLKMMSYMSILTRQCNTQTTEAMFLYNGCGRVFWDPWHKVKRLVLQWWSRENTVVGQLQTGAYRRVLNRKYHRGPFRVQILDRNYQG